MSLTQLIANARAATSPQGARINKKEMTTLTAAATPADVPALTSIAAAELTKGAQKVRDAFLKNVPTAPVTPPATNPTGPTPTQDVKLSLRASHQVWTTTYWPMAGNPAQPAGDPTQHLWATGGCLDKFDQLLKALGKQPGALAHEKRPALAWLTGKDSDAGYYVPSSTIREDDAEMTTGVDLDGDGKIAPGVKFDFVAGQDALGEKDGKTTGSYDVSWWGSCDKVALAGALFQEPKQAVTHKGVTFTPQDVKGLLIVIADSQVHTTEFKGARYNNNPDTVRTRDGKTLRGYIQGMSLKDFRTGNYSQNGSSVQRTDYDKPVTITLLDGTVKTIPVEDQVYIGREADDDSPAEFHATFKKWLGDKRPFCMDHDKGPHVWNDSYDGADITESATIPQGVLVNQLHGYDGAYKGGKLTFCTTNMLQGTTVAKRYSYWIEEKAGKVVNSGWLSVDRPDFLWRPVGAPTFTGTNERNPFVDPKVVKDIYLASIGQGGGTPTV